MGTGRYSIRKSRFEKLRMNKKTLRQFYDDHKGKVSDKWSLYLTEYDRVFRQYRDIPVRMLEIGVQNGGSLEIWSQYFDNGEVFVGVDIDDGCSRLEFQDPRISVIVADANSDTAHLEIIGISPEFDIVIDDGSHTSSDIVKSFVKYFPLIAEGGLYVAEDLHCSYWQEYEGGLFGPYASITFFKLLADIINYEHWGVEKNRKDLLAGFSSKYDVDIPEELLNNVYSVEFLNSICFIRKSSAQQVTLGERFIAGQKEKVVNGHQRVRGHALEVPSQLSNYWSSLDKPPAEAHLVLTHKISELNEQVNTLNTLASERLKTISELQSTLSWRITRPLRSLKCFIREKPKRALYVLRQLLRLSGWRKVYSKLKIYFANIGYKCMYKLDNAFTKRGIFKKEVSQQKIRGQIIVVSHNAYKEGAPLLALHLIKHLKLFFGYDVVTILNSGGDIVSEFNKYSKVYRFDLLDPVERAELGSRLYDEGYKLALCNTSVVGAVVEELKNANITCVALIHELPYVIKIAHLEESLKKILQYADYYVFPAQFVKDKLEAGFKINQDKSYIRHQGRYMRNPYLFRNESARARLREYLQCPASTKIVLNIGSGEYRKGIDLFVDTGIEVLSNQDNMIFVWVGKVKDHEIRAAQNKITQSNKSESFRFMDFEKDIGLFYSGSDIFYLSSREDPFPSVYIDAVTAGLPVVAFNHAGGFIELQASIGGILIEDFDTSAAAKSIISLTTDSDLYLQRKSASLEASRLFGFNDYIYDLLEIAGTELYRVSVIIPNYNYVKYIEGRLNSIFNQTVKPFEIIFLDDNSSDNSLEVASELLENSGFDYTIISSNENRGCYKQWLRGISAARGNIIWIAEADDLSETNFIERLLPEFDDKDISLVYCQSVAIDQNSNKMDFSYIDYTNELSTSRWKGDFTNDGENEIVNYMVMMNTVPNASGVLIRTSALKGLDKILSEFTSAGDWITYVYALGFGGISFVGESLNYHRRHDSSIIHTVMHDKKLLKEIVLVSKYILSKYRISQESKEVLANRYMQYYGLITSKNESLSYDEEFKEFFHQNGLHDLWKIVEDL